MMNVTNNVYEISKLITESKELQFDLINQLCHEAFETAKSKGWHDKPRSFGEAISLIHSEVSEALEADRRDMGKEEVALELADVIIRIFDASTEFDLDLATAIFTKMAYNKTRETRHGGKKY